MCEYHQTSPESTFTRKRVCTKATRDGRITLADQKLIVTRNGKKEVQPLGSEEEWRAALKENFEIAL
jgi:N-hydroxyarylamine O-acetyltransferase